VKPPTPASCPAGAADDLECLTVAVPVDPTSPGGATLNLAVTVRRVKPGETSSPVLQLSALSVTWFDWTSPVPASRFPGHDIVYVDTRGSGRSDGATDCPDVGKINGELNALVFSPEAAVTLKACLAKADASTVPLTAMLDHDLVAADLVAVRKALGIGRWAVSAPGAGADLGVRLVKTDGAAITAIVARAPAALDHGMNADTIAEAFDRLAADCAAVPSCATNGDLKAQLAKVVALPPVTTNTKDGNGTAMVLDANSLKGGIRGAMGNPDLAKVLPGLLSGMAGGSANDLVAGAFVRTPGVATVAEMATLCQDVDYSAPGLKTTSAVHGGLFTGATFKPLCDLIGPVPQIPPLPQVTSDIPVLVPLASYDGRSSETVATAIFTGFTNTSYVKIPGVSDPNVQVACYSPTLTQFVEHPNDPLDTSCLTSPDFATFK
jgi:pimeloyl-ACP methyl ester carboxylesterase